MLSVKLKIYFRQHEPKNNIAANIIKRASPTTRNNRMVTYNQGTVQVTTFSDTVNVGQLTITTFNRTMVWL